MLPHPVQHPPARGPTFGQSCLCNMAHQLVGHDDPDVRCFRYREFVIVTQLDEPEGRVVRRQRRHNARAGLNAGPIAIIVQLPWNDRHQRVAAPSVLAPAPRGARTPYHHGAQHAPDQEGGDQGDDQDRDAETVHDGEHRHGATERQLSLRQGVTQPFRSKRGRHKGRPGEHSPGQSLAVRHPCARLGSCAGAFLMLTLAATRHVRYRAPTDQSRPPRTTHIADPHI